MTRTIRTLATRLSLVLALVALVPGCDKSGLHPLGRVRDNLEQLDANSTTWVRSVPEGTQFLVLEIATLADLPAAQNGEALSISYGQVNHDSTTHTEVGTVVLNADGTGSASITAFYDFLYEPDVSVTNRDGAIRTQHDPPVMRDVTVEARDAQLLFSFDGEGIDAVDGAFTLMNDVLDRVDTNSQAGAEDIFRLFNLPLFTSQARLLGFGSTGMTQYIDSPADFIALITSKFRVDVSFTDGLKVRTLLRYGDYEDGPDGEPMLDTPFVDLGGIQIDGDQITIVSLGGNGGMEGFLNYAMFGTLGTTTSGILDYTNLEIDNGVAGGGTYTLTANGSEYVISYELASDIDLRNILPEAEGTP